MYLCYTKNSKFDKAPTRICLVLHPIDRGSLLLRAGAMTDARDHNGCTASSLAGAMAKVFPLREGVAHSGGPWDTVPLSGFGSFECWTRVVPWRRVLQRTSSRQACCPSHSCCKPITRGKHTGAIVRHGAASRRISGAGAGPQIQELCRLILCGMCGSHVAPGKVL